MAKLSHPNVAGIYQVGAFDGHPYIAMEYVRGHSLREWLRQDARPWAEIVSVFRQAGRGLAAAHEVGIVHRDFKPDNVIVGDDRVRVVDFGVAKVLPKTPLPVETQDDDPDASSARVGTWAGTPRYMAPEQRALGDASDKSDQYSFCVALREALADANIERRQRRALDRILERGLKCDPHARWPSMDALLAMLSRDPGVRRRKRVMMATGGGIAVAGMLVASLWWRDRVALCSGAERHLAGIWNAQQRSEIESAVSGSKLSYAPATWQRVEGVLDRYAHDWVEGHTQACEATSIRGEQSEAMMDLRMACLQRARIDLAAAVDLLRRADNAVVERAQDIVDGLPLLSRCADALVLEQHWPLPGDAEQTARVEDLRAQLARAQALKLAGKFDEARDQLRAMEERLQEIDYPPLHTEVESEMGDVLVELGRYEPAAVALKHALVSALEHGLAELGALTAQRLAHAYSEGLRQFAWAHWAADIGLGLARKMADPVLEGHIRVTVGTTHRLEGKYPEAQSELRRGIELLHDALGSDDRTVASARASLAHVLSDQGSYQESEDQYRVALEIYLRTLGEDHPALAALHNGLGALFLEMGKYADAEEQHRKALTILEASFGSNHPDVASARSNLGVALGEGGKHEQAQRELQAALRLREALLGPDHPEVASSHDNLGAQYIRQGDYAEAERELKIGVSIKERTLGSDHPKLANAHHNLATLFSQQGKYPEAEQHHREALRIRKKALGSKHPDVAASYSGLGALAWRQGDYVQAENYWRLQLELMGDEQHPDLAAVYVNLGTLLFEQDKYEPAERHWRRALEILLGTVGPEHSYVAHVHNSLGTLYWNQDKFEQAEREYRFTLEIQHKLLRADHPDIALTRDNLGALLGELKKYAAAERELRWALEVREKTLGTEHPLVATSHNNLGWLFNAQKKTRAAREHFERAWAIRSAAAVPPADAGETAFELAKLLWNEPARRGEALALAERATAAYREVADTESLREVERWRATHRLSPRHRADDRP